jgi:phospholipid/cholesterol/gamma-HCH transport system substrate-binding protein
LRAPTYSRAIALAVLITAITLVALALFGGGGGDYTVTARFINAGQIVKGNPVQAGGVPIGSVREIELTPGGQADLTLTVDSEHSPLPAGTRAAIRQLSQSGIANRFVDLRFPEHRQGAGTIGDGGRIGSDATTTQVDLDQVLNALKPETRKALKGLLRDSAESLGNGGGEQLGRGIEYLNPGLSTSARLLRELTRERPVLERTLVNGADLATALSERRESLAALVGTANEATGALARQKGALAESIELLPPVMRRANTSFLNLRATLDDLDPLVADAKPVARNLSPLLADARAVAAAAKPTLRDLRSAIRRPGKGNDAVEVLRAVPRLADIAVVRRERTVAPGGRGVSVGETPGAFPQAAQALRDASPVIAFARPYSMDFVGWLDDFSSTGGYLDALGGQTRTHVNIAENFYGTPPKTGQFKRCPGGADIVLPDRSNVLSADEQRRLECTEDHRAVR